MATIGQLIKEGEKTLAGGDSPTLDAELLLGHATGKSRTWLYTWPDHVPTEPEQENFIGLLKKRQEGMPVAYLCGIWGFGNLELAVNEHVLIPRPETELLVELALDRLSTIRSATVADLGTGSGAIALALAAEKPRWHFFSTDISADALSVARMNAENLAIGNVDFRQGDWTAPLRGKSFHAVLSNPPYVEEGDPHLSRGDVRFEPVTALTSGVDGLAAIRRIINESMPLLVDAGWLMLEHGYNQGERVRALFSGAGYSEVETAQDLAGLERVTVGRK